MHVTHPNTIVMLLRKKCILEKLKSNGLIGEKLFIVKCEEKNSQKHKWLYTNLLVCKPKDWQAIERVPLQTGAVFAAPRWCGSPTSFHLLPSFWGISAAVWKSGTLSDFEEAPTFPWIHPSWCSHTKPGISPPWWLIWIISSHTGPHGLGSSGWVRYGPLVSALLWPCPNAAGKMEKICCYFITDMLMA